MNENSDIIRNEIYRDLELGQLKGYVDLIRGGEINSQKIKKVQEEGVKKGSYTNDELKEIVMTGIMNQISFLDSCNRHIKRKTKEPNVYCEAMLKKNNDYLKKLNNGESIVIDGVEFNFD